MRWMRPEVIEIRLDNPDNVPEVKAVTGIVVLSVSGPGVISRQIGDSDPFLSRLKMNGSLMWTKHDDHVCYIPSAVLEPVKMQLDKCYIAGTVIGATGEESREVAERLKKEISNVKTMALSKPLCEFMMHSLYRKIRLPVLLFWLLVLVANFMVSSHLGEALNVEYRLKRQSEAQHRSNHEIAIQKEKMIADYQGLILPKSSVAFDGIASLMPDGVRLYLMERTKEHAIKVSGSASDISKILIYSELLKGMFNTVEIKSLETRANDFCYYFDFLIRQ